MSSSELSSERSEYPSDENTGTIVLLLGAGCSVDCGAPVMKSFMRRARELSRHSGNPLESDYRRLQEYRSELRRISSVLDRWWDNIEELFTQAHLAEIVGSEADKDRISSLRKVIWDVYRRPAPKDVHQTGYGLFRLFILSIVDKWRREQGPRPVVITTNYDVHFEAALIGNYGKLQGRDRRSTSLWVRYVANMEMQPDRSQYVCASESPLECGSNHDVDFIPVEFVKLHGSVNWFLQHDQGDTAFCNGSLGNGWSPEGPGSPEFWIQNSIPNGMLVESGDVSPLLIPPLLGKTSAEPVIRGQWKRAINALSHSRLIIIAGYSFPETDLFMIRLLAEAIKDNNTLEHIVVSNIDNGDSFRQRVSSSFARSWAENNLSFVSMPFDRFAYFLGSMQSPEFSMKDPPEAKSTLSLLRTYGYRSPITGP